MGRTELQKGEMIAKETIRGGDRFIKKLLLLYSSLYSEYSLFFFHLVEKKPQTKGSRRFYSEGRRVGGCLNVKVVQKNVDKMRNPRRRFK